MSSSGFYLLLKLLDDWWDFEDALDRFFWSFFPIFCKSIVSSPKTIVHTLSYCNQWWIGICPKKTCSTWSCIVHQNYVIYTQPDWTLFFSYFLELLFLTDSFSTCSMYCPNISTTPLQQWGFQQCLPFSWTTLKDRYCRRPIAVMGRMVVLSRFLSVFIVLERYNFGLR